MGEPVRFPPLLLLVPDSGELAPVGEEFRRGFEMGLGDSVPYSVVNTADSLVELRGLRDHPEVLLAVGPLLSSTCERLLPELIRAGVPTLLPTATEISLARMGSLVVFMNYGPFLEAAYALGVLAKKLGFERWSVLYWPRDPVARAVGDYLAEEGRSFGVEVLSVDSVPETRNAQYGLLKEVMARGRQGILLVGSGAEMAYLFLNIRKMGFRGPTVGVGGWMSPDVLEVISDAQEGLWVVAPKPPDFMSQALLSLSRDEFNQEYEAKYGQRPSWIAKRGYDAGQLAREALAAGEREGVLASLRSKGILWGISGSFILSGDPGLLEVWVLKRGTLNKERD